MYVVHIGNRSIRQSANDPNALAYGDTSARMDPDVPHPSIETDDQVIPRPRDAPMHIVPGSEEEIHAHKPELLGANVAHNAQPPSPIRTPKRSPSVQKYGMPPTHPAIQRSPSTKMSNSSPLNPERQTTAPRLHSRTSSTSLRNFTPSSPSRRSSTAMSMSRSLTAVPDDYTPPKPPPTAASIAKDHFTQELDSHSTTPAKTVVIVHDACYGHRFSRPRTTKAALSTIVERPERIRAGVLGLSAAYVRLGERHEGGKHPPKQGQNHPANVPFKIVKTSRSVSLTSAAATQVHPPGWMEELTIMCEVAENKLAANGKELTRPEGMENQADGTPKPRLHEGDLYLCSESLAAMEGCLGGVCEGVDAVFGSEETRRAFVCIRPPGHHCSSDFPSGFCWLNNVHVGIAHAAITHNLTHAAIIDFDLHHGDGSQSVAWDHNVRAQSLPKNAAAHKKVPIGYYSLHDINSYPCEMGDEEKVRNASLCLENAHGQSIWNVHLEPWKTHDEFWSLYQSRYSILLDKARSFLRYHTSRLNGVFNGPQPKAAIFLSAGFDASEWEGAGMQRHKVNVPTDFYARFTADVVKISEEEGLGVDGRVISVLEGGYSDRALTSGILSHICGLASGTTAAPAVPAAFHLDQQMSDLTVNDYSSGMEANEATNLSMDPEWWSPHNLETLEAVLSNGQAPPPPKKTKDVVPGNYSTPTQASSARSLSGNYKDRSSFSGDVGSARRMSLKPEGPPPEVDWATAAVELSRLLIPTSRTTMSCRHDELNAEATRARKARLSGNSVPAVEGAASPLEGEPKMQLRERKVRAPTQDLAPAKPASRASRRKTIAAVHDLEEASKEGRPEDGAGGRSISRSQRRVSDASSIISGFGNMQLDERTEVNGSTAQTTRDSSMMPDKIRPLPKAPVVRRPKPLTTSTTRAKPPTSARSSPKKGTPAPPVPQIPSTYASGSVSSRPVSNGSSENTAMTGSNMDDLASSVGKLKINLKVPTPEENAARERERASKFQAVKVQPTKERKPRAPRKPPIPKAAKAVVPKKENISTSAVANVDNKISARTPAAETAPVSRSTGQDDLPAAAPTAPPTQTKSSSVPVGLPPSSESIPAPAAPSLFDAKPNAPSEISLPQAVQQNQDVYSSEPLSSPLEQSTNRSPSQTVLMDAMESSTAALKGATEPSQSLMDPQQPVNPIDPAREDPGTRTAQNPMLEQRSPLQPDQTVTDLLDDNRQPNNRTSLSSPPLPPTSPPVKRTKADLPIFTSNSPIFFSNSNTNNAPSSTLPFPGGEPKGTNANPPAQGVSSVTGPAEHADAAAKQEQQSHQGSTIWDVPETSRQPPTFP